MSYSEIAPDIATMVVSKRKQLGLSQTALAEKAKVSRATVVRIENAGGVTPDLDVLDRILNVIGYEVVLLIESIKGE